MGKVPVMSRKKYNSLVIAELAKRFEVTEYYVRQCVNNKSESKTADLLREEYARITENVITALKK